MEQYREERERILRAAFALLGQGADAGVHDILERAGLSTRAFYRHFAGKDELVLTMYVSASDRLGEELSAAIAHAPDPPAALEAWIRQYLAVVFDPRRARQATMFRAAVVRGVPGYDQVRQAQLTRHATILAEVIRAGSRAGAFPDATDPDEDARAVLSVVNGLIEARLGGTPTPDWAEATRHTTALFRRALGAPED